MAISVTVRKILWSRAGNRCSMTGCEYELTLNTALGGNVVLGEECHIVAETDTGPRANPAMSQADRDDYPNLILLCPTDHTIIDKDPSTWPVDRLTKMKTSHEARVRQSWREGDEESRAEILSISQKFESHYMLGVWDQWTQQLMATSKPYMDFSTQESFASAVPWTLGLSPAFVSGQELKDLFSRLNNILSSLLEVLHQHSKPSDRGNGFEFEKFYSLTYWSPAEYEEKFAMWDQKNDTIHSLVFEATRMANWIIRTLRDLLPGFRGESPYLTITRGEESGASGRSQSRYYLPQYTGEDQATGSEAYTTLDAFVALRRTRDWWIEPE